MNQNSEIPPNLSDLDARLRAARSTTVHGDEVREETAAPRNMSGAGLAARIGVELVVTTMVGTAIGYALDDWLGSKPWLMIVFMVLGGAAGVMNVYRVVRGLDDSVGLGQAIERKKQRDAEAARKD